MLDFLEDFIQLPSFVGTDVGEAAKEIKGV